MVIHKKKQSPLRAALDNHRGVDYGLEKQRKQEKAAAKRKGLPPPLSKPAKKAQKAAEKNAKQDDDEAVIESGDEDFAEANEELDSGSVSDDEDEVVGGASLADQISKLAAAAAAADPDRDARKAPATAEEDDEDEDLEDVDDSDEEEEEDDEDADEDDMVEELEGVSLSKSKAKSRSNGTGAAVEGNDNHDDDDEEEEEEEEDESDIPLSDLEDLDDDADADADVIPHQRLTINNTTALTAALARIALPLSTLPFSAHLAVTAPTPTQIPDVDDDLNRELSLYAQALSAVQTARPLLQAEGAPFTRPVDYFAEMVKTDAHMTKIKARLVDEAARKKASADARRLRDAKKFGKAVQQERLKERAAAKRAMLDGVASLKRKRGADGRSAGAAAGDADEGLFDVALEDATESARRDKADRRADKGRGKGRSSTSGGGGRDGEPNHKRAKKNEKFGFGGKKRHGKSNDAESAGDVRGFSQRRNKAAPGAGGGRGGKKVGGARRPGKDRRAKMK